MTQFVKTQNIFSTTSFLKFTNVQFNEIVFSSSKRRKIKIFSNNLINLNKFNYINSFVENDGIKKFKNLVFSHFLKQLLNKFNKFAISQIKSTLFFCCMIQRTFSFFINQQVFLEVSLKYKILEELKFKSLIAKFLASFVIYKL